MRHQREVRPAQAAHLPKPAQLQPHNPSFGKSAATTQPKDSEEIRLIERVGTVAPPARVKYKPGLMIKVQTPETKRLSYNVKTDQSMVSRAQAVTKCLRNGGGISRYKVYLFYYVCPRG